MAIPDELKALPQWVVWAYRERSGRPTKPPYTPQTGRLAEVDIQASWGTYVQACNALATGKFTGLGFVLTASDPFCGIDLDHCIHSGLVERWAQAIVDHFSSYTETSPSGAGLHILIRATLPGNHHRSDAIELYDRERYFTMTGQRLPGSFERIEARQEELEGLYQHLFGREEQRASEPPASPQKAALELADEELIRRAMRAANGARFERLWRGDASGYRHADGTVDWSRADLALCAHLAFWTGGDALRMDRLFRQSGLYRQKWGEQRGALTYGQRTIARALAGHQDVYHPALRPSGVPGRVAPAKETV